MIGSAKRRFLEVVLASALFGVGGGFAWWAGRGRAESPPWRVALIGGGAIALSYPAWVFLMGLHLGAVYSPLQVLVYSAPLFLISGKFTVPMGLLAAFSIRWLLGRCSRPAPIVPRPATRSSARRGGPRFMQEVERSTRHDPAHRDGGDS